MLKIENSEIKFTISVNDAINNSDDFYYYSICFKLFIEFISKSIRYEAAWECYIGEIEEFKSSLVNLMNNMEYGEVIFSPRLETSKLVIEKIVKPYETYCFNFNLPTVVNSQISVQGMTILDQSYIPGIIMELEALLKLYS
ncbi:TPA: hypothetical protein QHO80_004735 [Escherichia coli]|nr:hypothetical protein [Escherichia coli]